MVVDFQDFQSLYLFIVILFLLNRLLRELVITLLTVVSLDDPKVSNESTVWLGIIVINYYSSDCLQIYSQK